MIVYVEIVYVENAKESVKTLLKLISNYSKLNIAGYKVNIQNTLAFLYTSNKQLVFEIKNTIYTSTRINEILRYKTNKIYARPI